MQTLFSKLLYGIIVGIFNLFSPPSYEDLENKGDEYFDAGKFGLAKLEYEKALSRLEAKNNPDASCHQEQIAKKLAESREALALQHKTDAEDLIEADCDEDAIELLQLALELTSKPELTRKIEGLLQDIVKQTIQLATDPVLEMEPDVEVVEEGEAGTEEEYFIALCSTLSEDAQEVYLKFSDVFKKGFITLNQGNFKEGAELLSQALEEHGPAVSYIHLELATAVLNLGDLEKAGALLTRFIAQYPDSIRAYEMLCDIFWENRTYGQAITLLKTCPDDLKSSVPIILLVGETLFRAEKFPEAVSFYLAHIERNGWNEHIGKSLAKAYEALGLKEKARKVYGEIMAACRGCGSQMDPFVKQRYADLSYEAGDISENILELYFSLCQEDPDNRNRYYQRISEIYSRHGHHEEANRYLRFI
jgi:tetratricopeptide (TPR) repeat protein